MDGLFQLLEKSVNGVERIGIVNFLLLLVILYILVDRVLTALGQAKALRQLAEGMTAVLAELKCLKDEFQRQSQTLQNIFQIQKVKAAVMPWLTPEGKKKIEELPLAEPEPCPPKEEAKAA